LKIALKERRIINFREPECQAHRRFALSLSPASGSRLRKIITVDETRGHFFAPLFPTADGRVYSLLA
jgi:hypothetical protein